jgi:hypothetical protein
VVSLIKEVHLLGVTVPKPFFINQRTQEAEPFNSEAPKDYIPQDQAAFDLFDGYIAQGASIEYALIKVLTTYLEVTDHD